jgi:hypothetical protein
MWCARVTAVTAMSLAGLLLSGGTPRRALAQPADPANSYVVPWDSYGHALMSPGTQSQVDLVSVYVRDANGDPIAGSFVEIAVGSCGNLLCIDEPSGLSGTTDVNGEVTLDPRVGGCADCPVTVTAGEVILRAYGAVSSPDWSRDGRVTDVDRDAFLAAYTEGDASSCFDYNGDGALTEVDDQISADAHSSGDANSRVCATWDRGIRSEDVIFEPMEGGGYRIFVGLSLLSWGSEAVDLSTDVEITVDGVTEGFSIVAGPFGGEGQTCGGSCMDPHCSAGDRCTFLVPFGAPGCECAITIWGESDSSILNPGDIVEVDLRPMYGSAEEAYVHDDSVAVEFDPVTAVAINEIRS